MTRRSPIDLLIDGAGLRCTICDAKMGQCDCWRECACGWSYQKGTACRNPAHRGKKKSSKGGVR